MAKKLDLNKIKDEIHKEKLNRTTVPSHMGESVGAGSSPRDVFLTGLLQARETGAETVSSNLIKVVENKVAEKHGEVKKHTINETPKPTQKPTVDMSPERDEQLFVDLEKKRKQTLAESIAAYQGNATPTNTPPAVNYNGQQFLTSVPSGTPTGTGGASMQINEAALVENVKNVVNGYLTENLGPIFEDAIKNTVIEMYAVERIQTVLNENRGLIAEVVRDVIKEIRAKSQAKAQ